MKLPSRKSFLPNWKNATLAGLSAVLLILAFPDFEYWFLAWFGLVPLLWAVEKEKDSVAKSFVLGWLWGIVFFFGTCWWLTYAPITYAGFPPLLAYFLLFWVTVVAGLFPAGFAGIFGFLSNRFGNIAIIAAPSIWVFSEFLRYWLTGNNWNAMGYSQSFAPGIRDYASNGGVVMVSFVCVAINCGFLFYARRRTKTALLAAIGILGWSFTLAWLVTAASALSNPIDWDPPVPVAYVVAIQPNVPMSGLTPEKWKQLRQKHVELAESVISKLNEQRSTNNEQPTTVIFPESPMNFMYDEDPEFQEFVSAFAAIHNVNVLFNSAEPDPENKKYFNSAVLIDSNGREVGQYDKIYLVPFGESVPAPLQSIVPAFVGSFSYGKEYDLLPLGDARAGVMICFESHFGELSREYVLRGADAIIEMTNDGYLGPTPVLRQHLANAVFRAVETNRPVLRVTNVGITAYITERGEVLDPTQSYTEDTRVWRVSKSDGTHTFYVKYGDWFAWLCSILTVALLIFGFRRRRNESVPPAVAGGEFMDKR